jgi:hypothetical protein
MWVALSISAKEIMTITNRCSVLNCPNSRGARRFYCEKHYRRELRHGSVNIVNKRGRKPKSEDRVNHT